MIGRKTGLNLWVVLVFVWALIRAFVINKVFNKYGVNGAIYLAIDLLSSIPYAITSGKALFAYLDKDHKRLAIQGFLASLSFFIPDLYIFIAATHVPRSTYIGLGIWILLMALLAIINLVRSSRDKVR